MKPHLTAIVRKKLPTPTRYLMSFSHFLHGDVLDYGCGKCAKLNLKFIGALSSVKSVRNYDPHFVPVLPAQKFDVIICNYVLCVLPKSEENVVLKAIQGYLKPDGVAYISVRNDVPKQGFGISSKKTLQRKVELNLPLVNSQRAFKMYRLSSKAKI